MSFVVIMHGCNDAAEVAHTIHWPGIPGRLPGGLFRASTVILCRPYTFRARMVVLQALVDQLREKCLEERPDTSSAGPATGAYSSLSQAPEEWSLEPGRPCSGERLLLMFDRYVGWLWSANLPAALL